MAGLAPQYYLDLALNYRDVNADYPFFAELLAAKSFMSARTK